MVLLVSHSSQLYIHNLKGCKQEVVEELAWC